jgi:hypothetical protein
MRSLQREFLRQGYSFISLFHMVALMLSHKGISLVTRYLIYGDFTMCIQEGSERLSISEQWV